MKEIKIPMNEPNTSDKQSNNKEIKETKKSCTLEYYPIPSKL